MDRRQFVKSIVLTPLFTPLLLSSQHASADAELFLISDTPHLILPPLLDELPSLAGVLNGRTYSFPEGLPHAEDLCRQLSRTGWRSAPAGQTAHISFSCSRLQAPARSSFTLAGEGKVWDIRARNLLSLWEELGRRHPSSSLLTVASVRKNPPAQAAGKTLTVYVRGQKTRTLPLFTDGSRIFSAAGGRIKFRIEQGKAWIAESSCRHKICMHCPPVSFAGERIICAPNRFLLEIGGPVSVDTIIG